MDLDNIILTTPGVLIFSTEKPIEIMPGIFSPIFLNIKTLLSYPKFRNFISEELEKVVSPTSQLICGIESGGSYYASTVAHRRELPVIFTRKESKHYGISNKMVGKIPDKTTEISIIDEVLATGNSLKKSLESINNKELKTEFVTVFSYGFDNTISKKLNVTVKSLTNISNIIQLCLKNKVLNQEQVDIINQHIATYEKFL